MLFYILGSPGFLPKGSNVVPFGQYITIPKKKIGHNPKGTTLEPLGSHLNAGYGAAPEGRPSVGARLRAGLNGRRPGTWLEGSFKYIYLCRYGCIHTYISIYIYVHIFS